MRNLGRREGAAGKRCESLEVETAQGAVAARVWVSANGHGRDLETDRTELAPRLRAAHGVVGNGTEYVRTVVQALELHGLRDALIDELWRRLRS